MSKVSNLLSIQKNITSLMILSVMFFGMMAFANTAEANDDSATIDELKTKIEELTKQITSLKSQIGNKNYDVVDVVPSGNSWSEITRSVSRGEKDNTRDRNVYKLQSCLTITGDYDEEVTGFFGPATEAAVKQFQAREGIVSTGNALATGFGHVGPRTRSLMNNICKDITKSSIQTESTEAVSQSNRWEKSDPNHKRSDKEVQRELGENKPLEKRSDYSRVIDSFLGSPSKAIQSESVKKYAAPAKKKTDVPVESNDSAEQSSTSSDQDHSSRPAVKSDNTLCSSVQYTSSGKYRIVCEDNSSTFTQRKSISDIETSSQGIPAKGGADAKTTAELKSDIELMFEKVGALERRAKSLNINRSWFSDTRTEVTNSGSSSTSPAQYKGQGRWNSGTPSSKGGQVRGVSTSNPMAELAEKFTELGIALSELEETLK